MTREIVLSRGAVALVDDEDFEMLGSTGWLLLTTPRGSRYAIGSSPGRNPRHPRKLMHRLVLGAPDGMLVDHINGDGLDNRRSNLRLATRSQNQFNQRRIRGASRFKGVERRGDTWRARVKAQGREYRSRYFDTEAEAAAAYDELARRHHGEFAALNEHLVP